MGEKSTKKSFLARVMDKLTGGDESKVARFQKKAVKSWESQINMRKDDIEKLRDKLSDLDEQYEDTLLAVDVNAIKTAEEVDAYIPTYTKKLRAVKASIKGVEAEIEAKVKEIEAFEEFVADLKN